MLRFLYVVHSKRSFDSSMDQGETASVERLFAAGHLQNTVGLGNERGRETTNVSSCSFRLTLGNKSVRVIPVLRETHTRILSDTTRRCLSI
jgi:hypothetical protein